MRKHLLKLLCVALAVSLLGLVACNGGSKPEATDVSLDKYRIELEIGQTDTVVCTVSTGEACVWSSDNQAVATVNDGVITAVGEGTANVTASVGEAKAVCAVTVSPINISDSNFVLDKKTSEIFAGYTLSVKPTLVYGSDTIEIERDKVVWSSDDEDIATVTDGVVTGRTNGTVTIRAEYEYKGKKLVATCDINVMQLAIVVFEDNYVLTLNSPKTLTNVNNEYNVSARPEFKVIGDEGEEVEYKIKDIKFASEDESIAVANEEGYITAKGAGTTRIVTTFCGTSTKFTVTVGETVASKADLDKIAYAFVDGHGDMWGADRTYVLSNDIDYNGDRITPIAPINDSFNTWVLSDEVWGELNSASNPRKFNATIDGNGFAIVNAKLNATYYYVKLDNDPEGYKAGGANVASCFIGGLKGTLKNIAFIGLTTENPKEATTLKSGTKISSSRMASSGLVARNEGTIENVYVEFKTGHFARTNEVDGVLAYVQEGIVKDCIAVADVRDEGYFDGDSAFSFNRYSAWGLFGRTEGTHTESNAFLISKTFTYRCGQTANPVNTVYKTSNDFMTAQKAALAKFSGPWHLDGDTLTFGSHICG